MSEQNTWYLETGEEVDLIEKCESGFIVAQYYEFNDGYDGGEPREPVTGAPMFVKKIYPAEMVPVLLPEIKARRVENSELIRDISAMRLELTSLKAERARLVDKLKQVPALQNLEMILDGKITHFVMEDYAYTTVHPIADLICKDDRGRNEYPEQWKLLTLFGKSKSDLQWRINAYSDGSGRNQCNCWLFTSNESAVEFAVSRLLKIVRELGDHQDGSYALKSFRILGVEPPAELVERVSSRLDAAHAQKIAKIKAELELLERSEEKK